MFLPERNGPLRDCGMHLIFELMRLHGLAPPSFRISSERQSNVRTFSLRACGSLRGKEFSFLSICGQCDVCA